MPGSRRPTPQSVLSCCIPCSLPLTARLRRALPPRLASGTPSGGPGGLAWGGRARRWSGALLLGCRPLHLKVVNLCSYRGACSEAVWWARWLQSLLPESVREVGFDFVFGGVQFSESVVRNQAESLEQALGRLASRASI